MEIQKDSLLPQFATVCELSDKDRFRNYSEEQEMNQRVHLRSRLGARKFSRCNQSFRYFSNLRRKIILNLIQQCEESAKERIKTGSEPRAHPFFSPKKSKDPGCLRSSGFDSTSFHVMATRLFHPQLSSPFIHSLEI